MTDIYTTVLPILTLQYGDLKWENFKIIFLENDRNRAGFFQKRRTKTHFMKQKLKNIVKTEKKVVTEKSGK